MAIARLVELRQHMSPGSDAEELLDEWTAGGSLPVQDPILYDQFPPF